MLHFAAFTANVAAAATDANLSLAQDGHWTPTSGGEAMAPYDFRIRGAFVCGTTLTRAKLNSPSLRAVAFPWIRPIQLGTAPGDLPSLCIYEDGHEPLVRKVEAFNIQTTNTAAGAERHTAFVWAEPMYQAPPPGPLYTLRLTSAVTGSANQWDAGTLTPTDTIPAGRYAVLGITAFGANCIGVRLLPAEGGPRPGNICMESVGLDDFSKVRFGRMGKLMEFESTALPSVEFFKTAAGVTQETYLDVVKLT